MRCKDYKEAIAQAEANANRTSEPWEIFRDKNGVIRCEPLGSKSTKNLAIVYPQGKQHAIKN